MAMIDNKGQFDQADSEDKNSKREEDEDEDPNVYYRRLDKKFGKKKVDEVLKESEIDLYEEFLEPSETRFSKTNIFTNYKEFHNRRNFNTINRSKDKKYFKKQIRLINKDKQIEKTQPTWASDVDLIRKVQIIQTKLIQAGLLKDSKQFDNPEDKRAFLAKKVERLCALMDREYEANLKRLKKQREDAKREQKKKELQMQQSAKFEMKASGMTRPNGYPVAGVPPPKMSRAAMLAQGYTFKNPRCQQIVENLKNK